MKGDDFNKLIYVNTKQQAERMDNMKKQGKIRKPKWLSVEWLKANYAKVIVHGWVILCLIISILIFLNLCFVTDFKAATRSDWDYLYEKLDTLEKEGTEAFANMEDIKLTLEDRTLTVESEQCRLILEMNNENVFVETSKEDKAFLGGEILGIGISIIVISGICGLGFFALGIVLLSAIQWCFIKINLLLKRKRES